jgi:hypothetical protein
MGLAEAILNNNEFRNLRFLMVHCMNFSHLWIPNGSQITTHDSFWFFQYQCVNDSNSQTFRRQTTGNRIKLL